MRHQDTRRRVGLHPDDCGSAQADCKVAGMNQENSSADDADGHRSTMNFEGLRTRRGCDRPFFSAFSRRIVRSSCNFLICAHLRHLRMSLFFVIQATSHSACAERQARAFAT